MIEIEVELLHGWLRAVDESDGATMGNGEDAAEWPPSPARLFSALVAAGGTGDNRGVIGDDSELIALEGAEPPEIWADSLADVIVCTLNERFVVVDSNTAGYTQNYPARSNIVARPGIRIHPKHPVITFRWPSLTLDEGQLAALRQRVARIGYLGASDAPARAVLRVGEGTSNDPAEGGTTDTGLAAVPPSEAPEFAWLPNTAGSERVSVPFPGFLELLDNQFAEFSRGRVPSRSRILRKAVRYSSPGPAPEPVWELPVRRLWADFDRSLPGTRVVEVAEAVKGLVLSAFGEGAAPAVLHGHGLKAGDGRARFVPLPFASRSSRATRRGSMGRLFGVMIELPADLPNDLVQQVQGALIGRQLTLGDSARFVLASGATGRKTAEAGSWERTSHWWSSVSPVVWDRWANRRDLAETVAQMCANAGLPAPSSVEVERASFVQGGLSLAPWQVRHRDNSARPYAHVRIGFDQPVAGPFLLGRMRSYGLGLFCAVPDPAVTAPAKGGAADHLEVTENG